MPDGQWQGSDAEVALQAATRDARYDRPGFIAFVADAKSEEALHDGVVDIIPGRVEIRRGGIKAAIAAMQKQVTPKVLVVDISEEEQPLTALVELANVVEPDVCVLAVGKIDHVDFYREVTRGLGVAEYITKPLNRDLVARHFGPFLRGQAPVSDAVQGGRAISVTGVRGGVGATTMAVNLAWNFGVWLRRHTVLLDPDIHLGAAAFLLNLQPGPGLRMALEAPDRIDALLAERAAQPAADRLHVLAGEEKMTTPANHAPGAAASLMTALRRRYNFIIVDVPFAPVPLYRDLLDLVDHRILVLEPTLAAIRDTVRLLALPKGASQNQRATIVLNRAGLPGGLTRRQVEDALKIKVDVVIPDLPRQVGTAATLGEPALVNSSAFRSKVLEVANLVASMRMVDALPPTTQNAGEAAVSRWHWFKRRR
jgi:pilus assembly protein CpaE